MSREFTPDLLAQRQQQDIARYGIARETAWRSGTCINCKQPAVFHSFPGLKFYSETGLCEPCQDDHPGVL